ncbi:MAG TPA: ABC transporter permease [Gemmatimonadales bacterium]|nr:ABC transporter permease [Gemmatimonadales bacterium]
MSLLHRLWYYLRRSRFEGELNEELSHHLDLAAQQAEAQGLDPAAARLAARRRLGSPGRVADSSRDQWRFQRLETLMHDLRYALRGLARQPAHSAAGGLTLALGIGATTAIASILFSVLLRPLPYREPERLVQIWERNFPRNRDQNVVSPANYLDWRDRSSSFSGMALYTWSQITLIEGRPEQLEGRLVSPDLLQVLGVTPALGRGFREGDGAAGAPRALLLTHRLWQRAFGGDSAVVGRAIRIREGDAVVIGVLPPEVHSLDGEEYWAASEITEAMRVRRGRFTFVIGRLRDGVTLAQAQADLDAIAKNLETEYPGFNTGWGVNVVPLMEQVVGSARPVLAMVTGAIGLVLLIACANVASLTLARALGRQGELTLRTALGATRGRVVRQLMVEGLVLAAAGGLLGIGLGYLAVGALKQGGVTQIPRLAEVEVDLRVLAVSLAVTTLAGLLCGLVPALGLGGKATPQNLMGQAGRFTASRGSGRLRAGLVVVQVALSLLLLAGTGLMIRSLVRLLRVDPGFVPAQVATAGVTLPVPDYPAERRDAFYDELVGRAAALPGVRSVGLSNGLPLTPVQRGTAFWDADAPEPPPGEAPVADIRTGDPGLVATLGMRLLRGRTFESGDRAGAPDVVVVNRALVQEVWGDGDPLGRRLFVRWGTRPEANGVRAEVIGVIEDVRVSGLDVTPRPMIVFSHRQQPEYAMHIALKVEGDAAGVFPLLERELAALDPALPLLTPRLMSDWVAETTADRRYPMLLLAILAGLALSLASVGLYGVLSYFVGERTREIGVRRALGASNGSVVTLVLSRGVRLVGLGILLGGIGVIGAMRLLEGLLYEVGTTAPLAIGGAVMLLALVGAAACLLPAVRAARVDPAVTLRGE